MLITDQGDKDTLLFRRSHAPAPPIELVSVSFNEDDKLRLIGAPSDLPPAIRQVLGPAIQSESKETSFNTFVPANNLLRRGQRWRCAIQTDRQPLDL